MNDKNAWLSDMIKTISDEFKKFKENHSQIKDTVVEVVNTIKENLLPIYEQFIEQIKLVSRVVVIDTPIITVEKIVSASRGNMVSSANEIVALKEATEKEKMVWLTYSANRELLPQEKNKYIVIKGDSFDEEVEKLFGEEKIIILK